MSKIGSGSEYNVAGYKEGDRIGAGIVVDPARLTKNDEVDTKLVDVDLDLNGKIDQTDDKVLVKLPPKGVIPANWQGIAKLEGGGKGKVLLDAALVPARTGAILGGTAGFLASMPMVGKFGETGGTAAAEAAGACIWGPLLGMAVGAGIGAMSGSWTFTGEDHTHKARNALIGMGIGGALGTAVSYGMAGLPKGLIVIGGTAIAGALITGGVAAYNKNQEISADSQKARTSSVPDVVAPKYILNQYLMKQTENK